MARRRLGRNERTYITLGILGLFMFTFFIWLLSQIVWNSVAGAMLALIAGSFAIYAVFHFVRVTRYHYLKASRMEVVSRIKSTTQMQHLSPTDFEHYVAALYENLGYSAKVTQQSGDGGIDVVLRDKEYKTIGIQVKRFDSHVMVQRPDIQKLVGACKGRFDKMVFVTSSDFSEGAYNEAADQGVSLVNGGALEAMVKRVSGKDPKQESFVFKLHHRMHSR